VRRVALVAVLAALGAAGCGGDDETTVTVNAPASQGEQAPAGTAQGGGSQTSPAGTETSDNGGATAPAPPATGDGDSGGAQAPGGY